MKKVRCGGASSGHRLYYYFDTLQNGLKSFSVRDNNMIGFIKFCYLITESENQYAGLQTVLSELG